MYYFTLWLLRVSHKRHEWYLRFEFLLICFVWILYHREMEFWIRKKTHFSYGETLFGCAGCRAVGWVAILFTYVYAVLRSKTKNIEWYFLNSKESECFTILFTRNIFDFTYFTELKFKCFHSINPRMISWKNTWRISYWDIDAGHPYKI